MSERTLTRLAPAQSADSAGFSPPGSASGSNAGSSIGSAGAGDAGPAASASKMPKWLGKRVGRYRLVSLLGVGTWGKVFEAEDTTLRRRIALKLIPASRHPQQAETDFARVIREARAAAALEHPNVSQVYEVGRHKDLFFIAMELAEGGSLEDLVRASGPMDPVRACQLVADAADAMAVAHACGIVHRDIKPANLLLSRNGRCKVTDFGLALMEEASDPQHAARIAGTSHYVAPEVIRGKLADARSDVYGLGTTLYHLLSGRRPFQGGGRSEVLRAHLEKDVPDLLALRPGLDPKLAAVVARAMSKDPAERIRSMEQLARSLRMFTVAVPVAEMPLRRKHPPRMVAALAGAALLGLAVILWLALRSDGPAPAMASPPAASSAAPAAASPEGPALVASAQDRAPVARFPHRFSLDTRNWTDQPQTVHVAGEFNDWSTTATPLRREGGVWSARLQVPQGLVEYKFIIDGARWLNDPASDRTLDRPDSHGGTNSGVMVGPK